jgi:putative glutamine amidotransferase
MKPLIGILPNVDGEKKSKIENTYVRAIEQSGGAAIMLPYTESQESIERFVGLCDGFIFAGGADIEPCRYGEERHENLGETTPYRDQVEFLTFAEILKTRKPIMGICRGSQLINVALGGTLYQDIPSEIKSDLTHKQEHPHSEPAHEANVVSGSLLHLIIGKSRININSLHHQAIKGLGRGLEPMAVADDGIIEAIHKTDDDRLLWGFQWHPEKTFDNSEDSRAIFKKFVEECGKK